MTAPYDKTYAVMGLGYVGLGLATALGLKSRVIGFDINLQRIAELQQNNDANRLIDAATLSKSNILYTHTIADIKDANFYLIAVPTPAYFYETPNLEPLLKAVQQLAVMLKPGDIVVFESTVYPGTTDNLCIPTLERLSGLKHGVDFHVGYSPERITPGDEHHQLHDLTKIIAAPDPATLQSMQDTYLSICADVYPVSSIAVAEAIKILENTQRDVNIALMNEFTKIMHALNLDMHEIIAGAKTKWSFVPFHPGLVSGHCIAIDSHYLAFQAKRHGVQHDLILTARKVNDGMTQFIIQSMLKLCIQHHIDTRDMSIGMLGVAYKENIHDIRNSLSIKLIKELHEHGFRYHVHDPMVDLTVIPGEQPIQLQPFASLKNVSVIILTVGHDFYQDMGLEKIVSIGKKPPILLDIPNLFVKEQHQLQDLIYWNL